MKRLPKKPLCWVGSWCLAATVFAVRAGTLPGVGYLDLARLGLLGYRDGCCEHADLLAGSDVLTVEAVAEEQVRVEVTLGSRRHRSAT